MYLIIALKIYFAYISFSNGIGGSMTALNPLNPKSVNPHSSQRQKQKRRNVKNGSVSSGKGKSNKVSPGKTSLGTVSQLSSPSIHVPGLPEVDQQQKRSHRLTSSQVMTSKSTLDDIDDIDEASDKIRLTNGKRKQIRISI